MNGIAGKNVLITGASSGIGQATAIYFGKLGANVVVNYYKGEENARDTQQRILDGAKEAGQEVRVTVVQADVSKEEDVQRMFETAIAELGGLDFLINNAGINSAGSGGEAPSHEHDIADFDRVMSTNARGAFLCARAMIRHLLDEEKAGAIVNVSSVHQLIPKPGYIGYSASKGAMQNLTRTLALEYADRQIRVNAVGPGAIVTPMNEAWINDPEKREQVASHIPMGRAGEADEMAAVIAFLCADEASYITGQTIFADGGLTLFADFRENWSS